MNFSTLLPNWRFAVFSIGLLLSACVSQPINKGIEDIVPDSKPPRPTTLSPYGSEILSSYSGSYALLIGESQYTNGWSNLESIPGELQKVEQILISQGFTVEKAFNLNKRQLTDRFEKFIDQYGFEENNRLLFFYSGHGYTRDDKGYIVPVNAPNPNFNEKGFLRKAVGMNQVLTWARRIEAKHVLFLFDSCFSGTVFKAKDLPKIPRQITEAAENPVRQFITAGSAEQKVPAKSVFTPAFVDALRYGWGDLYKDGYVTGEELGLYLKNKVPQHTSSNQTPQYGTIQDYELSRGNFVFVVGGGKDSEGDRLADTQAEQARFQAQQQRLARQKEAMAREQADIQAQQQHLTREKETIRRQQAQIRAEKQRLARQQELATSAITATPLQIPSSSSTNNTFASGKVFRDRLRDGSLGPEMVWIPAGTFRMGDIQGGGNSDEKPVHTVSVKRFAMGRYEVTVGEYLRFVRATGRHAPEWQEVGSEYNIQTGTNNHYKRLGSALTNENHPIVGISWHDAVAYAQWLSQQTGHQYRLPTEAEWEYAARAGTETKYWWGNEASHDYANYGQDECCGGLKRGKDRWEYTSPVGSFASNQFGLYDTVGNVWEWTCSVYEDSYQGAEQRCANSDSLFVLRGGSWDGSAGGARSAGRNGGSRTDRNGNGGFRLARIL